MGTIVYFTWLSDWSLALKVNLITIIKKWEKSLYTKYKMNDIKIKSNKDTNLLDLDKLCDTIYKRNKIWRNLYV